MNQRTQADVKADMSREGDMQRFQEELQRKIYLFEDEHNINKAQMMTSMSMIIGMHLEHITQTHIEYVMQDVRLKNETSSAEKDQGLVHLFFGTLLPEVIKFQQSEEEGRCILADLMQYMIASYTSYIRSDYIRWSLGFPAI